MPVSRLHRGAVATAVALALSGLTGCGGSSSAAPPASAARPAASPTPAVSVAALRGVRTSVTLAPAFLKGLTALQLTPAPVGSATLDAAAGVVGFPITGGNLTYFDPTSGVVPYVRGRMLHAGSGLQLTGPTGTVVQLTDFEIDPGASMLYGRLTVDGAVKAERAELLFLDGRTLNPLRPGDAVGTAVLQGTTVTLTPGAAEALDAAFATSALTPFFPVGIAEITIKTS